MKREQEVASFTEKKIMQLTNRQSGSAQRAALAHLRQGAGRVPGEMPQLWGEILYQMPEEMYSQSGEPSREEWAVYTALTLFALHQQGRDPGADCMHREGVSLGTAVSGLVHAEQDRERIWKRFVKVVTAGDMIELSYHLRGIVQLLRAEGTALDYAALAKELYLFQTPHAVQRVKLRWGQDFYRIRTDKNIREDLDEKA